MKRNHFPGIFITLLLAFYLAGARSYIHHELKVQLSPQDSALQVTDHIQFPHPPQFPVHFLLHAGLNVSVLTPGVKLLVLSAKPQPADFQFVEDEVEIPSQVPVQHYQLVWKQSSKAPPTTIELKYEGKIYHPIKAMAEEYERAFSQTPGIICPEGVYLAGSSVWVPWFGNALVTFQLQVTLPAQWDVVSQGERIVHEEQEGSRLVTWQCQPPMEEIYLVAGTFHEYSRKVGRVLVQAFLRKPDVSLANKYLGVTGQYLQMYEKLIGPYPYKKFALVENFWETGYGMPSFTLLGPQVIRFPFILYSSYPHELLHNWWGNGVYVKMSTGNWCEGLTAYLADHLLKEQVGQGWEYRRSILQKFTNYVLPELDFPLTQFRNRYSAASEAIGYGKTLMMFHMLRKKIGDEKFRKVLQTFYREFKFRRASFTDIATIVSQVTGQDFQGFFQQWTTRKGAPYLMFGRVKQQKKKNGYEVRFTLQQKQAEQPFTIDVPIYFYLKNEKKPRVHWVTLSAREQTFEFSFPAEVAGITVDPNFDVFRRLDRMEMPPSLSAIFGAKKVWIILPSKEEKFKKAYEQLAQIWSADTRRQIIVKWDNEVEQLPKDASVWIFGHQNRFMSAVKKVGQFYRMNIEDGKVQVLGEKRFGGRDISFVVALWHPQNPNQVIVWLTIGNAQASKGLARKLPHYGKYSVLAFKGAEPQNILKMQWPVINSPLKWVNPSHLKYIPFQSRKAVPEKPLATLPPVYSSKRMMEIVRYLASPELEGRGLGTQGIEKAAEYIARQFREMGLKPGGDNGSYFQQWEAVTGPKHQKLILKNVVAYLPGVKHEYDGQSVVVCAHYDHLGYGWPDAHAGDQGKIHPGADDNASGVAVMLELARQLSKTLKPDRTIVFVAFTGEEAGLLGSRYYVQHMKKFPASKIIGVINLDTVGRLGNGKILVLNSQSAREWPFIFMGSSYVTGVAAQMSQQDLDSSDQVSFLQAGIPAVQIFTGAHLDYHRPTDTPDKIDAEGMVKVARFVQEAVEYLAGRERPLTVQIKAGGQPAPSPAPATGKRASAGFVPDFTFTGQGVRVAQLVPHSPAEKAGIKTGDIIVAINGVTVKNLREYANELKKYKPGDTVQLRIQRNGQQMEITLKLMAR